jgi:hypothetical protein
LGSTTEASFKQVARRAKEIAERFVRIAGQTLRVFQTVKSFYWLLILLLVSIGQIGSVEAAPASADGTEAHFPKPVEGQHDSSQARSAWDWSLDIWRGALWMFMPEGGYRAQPRVSTLGTHKINEFALKGRD